MTRPILAVAFTLLLVGATASALETDQYYAWGRPLADSTGMVNAKLNLELERAIASFPEGDLPVSCSQIAAAYRKRMRFVLLHDIQIWVWNTRWVDRVPNGREDELRYRQTNLYSRHPTVDPGTWMPFTPTIEVAGVRFGTDKLAHLVSSGWTYYGVYRKGLKEGDTPDQAERRAVRRGILEESLILGKLASGILSVADIEASYAGLHFYIDLCDCEDPVLKRDATGWIISRPIDISDFVTPRWDESYQPPAYNPGRWRKVEPVLETYCDRLDDPTVVAMRRGYRERDRETLVGELVAERVADGTIPDPSQFSLEVACDRPDPSRQPAPGNDDAVVDSGPEIDPITATARIIEEEENRRRFALGLPGLHLSYPQVVTASIAVMATSQPRSYDCTSPCDFRGWFAELQPGLGGGKLSIGRARVTGRTNRSGSLLRAGYIGAATKLTMLRTWGDLGWVEGGRTYAGVELGVPVAQANIGIGLLYRVDSADSGRWLVTGGAGWGF